MMGGAKISAAETYFGNGSLKASKTLQYRPYKNNYKLAVGVASTVNITLAYRTIYIIAKVAAVAMKVY